MNVRAINAVSFTNGFKAAGSRAAGLARAAPHFHSFFVLFSFLQYFSLEASVLIPAGKFNWGITFG